MDDIEQLESVCRKILDMDPGMRYAGIINCRGRPVAGGMREGLKSLEDARQDEMVFTEIALRVKMRHEFDAEFGPVHFSLSYRDRIIVMSFPLRGDMVLLVSGERSIDFCTAPIEILKLAEDLRDA